MSVSRVTVRNYKCIDELEVKLSGLNVIVGVNGTGKTSFLEAVALAASAPNEFRDIIGESVLRRVLGRRVVFEYYVRLGARRSEVTVHLGSSTVKVELAGDYRALDVVSDFPYARHLLEFAVGSAKTLYDELHALYVSATGRPQGWSLIGVVYGGRLKFTGAREVGHVVVPLSGAEESRAGPSVFFADEALQDPDTMKLVIAGIISGGLKRKLVKYLADSLREQITDLDVVGDKVYVYLGVLGDKPIPLEFLGDGTVRYVALAGIATLMEGVGGRSVLLLEEPELHMHPGLLRLLGGMLVELPRRGVQVVVSTHSPELLRSIGEAAEQIGLDDIAFFYFTRDSRGRVVVSEYEGLGEVLPELDYLAERLYAIA